MTAVLAQSQNSPVGEKEMTIEVSTKDFRLNEAQLDFLIGGKLVASGGGLHKMFQAHLSFAIVALIVEELSGAFEKRVKSTTAALQITFNVATLSNQTPFCGDYQWSRISRSLDIRLAEILWKSKRIVSKAHGFLVLEQQIPKSSSLARPQYRKLKSNSQSQDLSSLKTPGIFVNKSRSSFYGASIKNSSKSSDLYASALKTNTSLYILHVGDCPITDYCLPIVHVASLQDAIQRTEVDKHSLALILLEINPIKVELNWFIQMLRGRGVFAPIIGNKDTENVAMFAETLNFPIDRSELDKVCERYRIIFPKTIQGSKESVGSSFDQSLSQQNSKQDVANERLR